MDIYVECPNCGFMVEIIEMNCGIFRHGVYKDNNIQLNPHAPEDLCKQVFEDNLIYGCGKPFRIGKINDEYVTSVCDYV